MNREETLNLHNLGVVAWNNWANQRLIEKKKLEKTGEWTVNQDGEPENEKTIEWFKNSEIIFSQNDLGQFLMGSPNFNDYIFPGIANFKNFIFKNDAYFSGAIFKDKANFTNAKFEKLTLFTNTTFNDEIDFENAVFQDEIAFEGGAYLNNVNFQNATFNKIASFKIIFVTKANFLHAIFNGKVNFNGSIFKGDVHFNCTNFNKEAEFHNTKFYGITYFSLVNFYEETHFNNSNFYNDTYFQDINFHNNAWFNEVKFHQEIYFTDSRFNQYSSFLKTTFYNNTCFRTVHCKGYTDFSETLFKKETNFSALISESAFTLEHTKFQSFIPNFIQANFKEAPRLDNIKFGESVPPGNYIKSITTFIPQDIKARYQALKRLAVQAHDHENEQRFWAGELRSDRSLRNEDGSWNRRPLVSAFWWGNIAYGFFSDYGRSIVRPLISLFILLCIMTNIHLFAHNSNKDNQVSELRTKTHITKQSDLKDCDIRSSAFRVAAKNGAIGLLQNPAKRSIFERDYACLYGTYNDNKTPKIPNSIFWIEILHTLFSAILIFLTLLGIRNNFKLK